MDQILFSSSLRTAGLSPGKPTNRATSAERSPRNIQTGTPINKSRSLSPRGVAAVRSFAASPKGTASPRSACLGTVVVSDSYPMLIQDLFAANAGSTREPFVRASVRTPDTRSPRGRPGVVQRGKWFRIHVFSVAMPPLSARLRSTWQPYQV